MIFNPLQHHQPKPNILIPDMVFFNKYQILLYMQKLLETEQNHGEKES